MSTTTPLHKLLVSIHIVAAARFDESISAQMREFTRRADADPFSAALLADVDAWLQGAADPLVAGLLDRMEKFPPLGQTEMRLIVRALSTIATTAGADALASEILSRAVGKNKLADMHKATQDFDKWVRERAESIADAVRSAVRKR